MTTCLFRIVALVAAAASCASTVPEEEARQRIEELEREVLGLQAKLRLAEERLGIASESICDTAPRVDGRVLEIAEDRTVVLDVGSDHGVESGFTFSVYLGSVFHGQVRVTRVDERTSLAVILGEKKPIAVGDSASTGI